MNLHPPCNNSGSSPSTTRRRKISLINKREKQDFFKKYSPLSSARYAESENSCKNGKKLPHFVMDPTGKQAYHWLFIVAVAVMYFSWTICLRTAFDVNKRRWFLWTTLDTAAYSIYLLDIFIHTRTSFLKEGILECDIEKLKHFYLQSSQFKFDIASSIPLDWIYMALFHTYPPPLLHCLKLLKLYQVRQFNARTGSRSHYPNACRVLILLHNLLIIIHWNACGYYLLSQWIGLGSDSWVYPAWNATHNVEWGTFSRQYIYSFYWSMLTLTSIGELPHPHTNLEYTFMTVEYLIGIVMFATLVGNIGSIIDNMQKSLTEFQNRMDNIKKYMTTTNVPENLQERVIKWFDYLWSYGNPMMSEQTVLDALPDKLKAEIGIHVHFETLKKVEFFEECEQGLLWEIVLRLRTQIYSPGEYVCRKGDVGREMYIVNSGKLEVLEEEDGDILKDLQHGEYFGEISVLNLGFGKSHRRRTAFVRSLGYTSLLCLTQADLLDVLKDYPKTKDMLIKKGIKKLQYNVHYEDEEGIEHKHRPHLKSATSISEDEGYSPCSTPDSNDINLPPMELRTMADQVVDLSDRLNHIEELIQSVLVAMKNNNSCKNSCKNNVEEPTAINSIKKYIRRISTSM